MLRMMSEEEGGRCLGPLFTFRTLKVHVRTASVPLSIPLHTSLLVGRAKLFEEVMFPQIPLYLALGGTLQITNNKYVWYYLLLHNSKNQKKKNAPS